MTQIELLLIFLLIILVVFLVYYFFKGSTGKVAFKRPVESRIDEYLDRRFEGIIEEWSLVRRPKLQKFKDDQGDVLDKTDEKIRMLKAFESEMKDTLSGLEDRLNALESSLASKGSGKR